jgi:type IV fimbrial biogenesis protein FimT
MRRTTQELATDVLANTATALTPPSAFVPFVGRKITTVVGGSPLGRQVGFTLLELMAVIVIASILFSVAIPSMRSVIQNNRIVTETNDFMADLNLARSEALKKNATVVLCKSSTATSSTPLCDTTASNWGIGWIVYLDSNNNAVLDAGETVFRVHEPFVSDTTLNASAASDFANRIIYAKSGTLGAPPGGAIPASRELDLCDTRGPSQGRSISLQVTGRPTIARNPATCTPP